MTGFDWFRSLQEVPGLSTWYRTTFSGQERSLGETIVNWLFSFGYLDEMQFDELFTVKDSSGKKGKKQKLVGSNLG